MSNQQTENNADSGQSDSNTLLERSIKTHLNRVRANLSKGKGEWPKPGYVRDEVWAIWRAEELVLQSILRESGIEF